MLENRSADATPFPRTPIALDQNNQRMTCSLDQPNVLCVASSDQQDKKSSFSNTGSKVVHVFAPGTNIYSTAPANAYRYVSSTGMACPHASGLAALILTMRGNLNGQAVKKLIEENVQKKIQYTGVVSSGGLIDVAGTIRTVKKQGTLIHFPSLHFWFTSNYNI